MGRASHMCRLATAGRIFFVASFCPSSLTLHSYGCIRRTSPVAVSTFIVTNYLRDRC